MSNHERFVVYLVLIILVIWVGLQQIELRAHHELQDDFITAVKLQREVLELDGKRLDLLEELLVMQSFSPP